ncbi:MAG: fliS [Acidimicrobiales bacterium]|nr:fliS [Acidimicrobiales bacterium]
MTLQAAQNWYVEETVATATPSRLLCLLYDRLARDLGQARTALLAGRRGEAEAKIDHACDIFSELLTTLDGDMWPGAGDLARIYSWMVGQLIAARVRGDAALVVPVHELVMQLGSAWHEVADSLDGKAAVSA